MLDLPLTSARLRIAMMRAEHASSLVAYRNDPEVARFQDWELPFTEEMAARLIAEQAAVDGPTDQTWVQLAVEFEGIAIGDVAVGIHDRGRQATIGYSIMSSYQGKGCATEAVATVIDALFTEPAIHRIIASIDPANRASQRVLDKLGFRFEGRSLSSVFVRGEWVDDDRYALLATDRAGRLTPNDHP